MTNFQKLKIEINGDLIIKKGDKVFLDSLQLYDIVHLLLEVKQSLPEDWVLETEQYPEKGRFDILLGARSFEKVPTETIGTDADSMKNLHREGEYFYQNNQNIPGGPEAVMKEIKMRLKKFGIAEDDYSIYFHRRKGLIQICFESKGL